MKTPYPKVNYFPGGRYDTKPGSAKTWQKILVLAHQDRRAGAFAVHRPRAVEHDGVFVFAEIIEGYHTLPAPGV